MATSHLRPVFEIFPPLLNSASPWATTIEQLSDLYNCPFTGAVTIRTSLLDGFDHDPHFHQYMFFDPALASGSVASGDPYYTETSSLNTLGYSPIPLGKYLALLTSAARGDHKGFLPRRQKPIIVSVTGTAEEVARCYELILEAQEASVRFRGRKGEQNKEGEKGIGDGEGVLNLMMEINLSCPNIPDKTPPAYDGIELAEYFRALAQAIAKSGRKDENLQEKGPSRGQRPGVVLCGIKTPPYTYTSQFHSLISALESSAALEGGCPIAFITSTNTLGSCLVLKPIKMTPAIYGASGTGLGGLAGASLHPLALGNVSTLRKMLDASAVESVWPIQIIGVGGVSDTPGFERMITVGAAAVGVGTELGRMGVQVFETIYRYIRTTGKPAQHIGTGKSIPP